MKDSSIKSGYSEITRENIEQVLEITLTEQEKELIGANYKVDISGIIQEKCRAAGVAPYGNARARAKVWTFPDVVPLHREPLHSSRPNLFKKYPTYADQEDNFRVDVKFISEQQAQEWAKDFPVMFATMRVVNLSGAGIHTRTSKYLADITLEIFANIHPELAVKHGLRDGDMMWLHSPQGTKIKVKARRSRLDCPTL